MLNTLPENSSVGLDTLVRLAAETTPLRGLSTPDGSPKIETLLHLCTLYLSPVADRRNTTCCAPRRPPPQDNGLDISTRMINDTMHKA